MCIVLQWKSVYVKCQSNSGRYCYIKHNGTFTHTGIVTGVNGDYFTTIEGNQTEVVPLLQMVAMFAEKVIITVIYRGQNSVHPITV